MFTHGSLKFPGNLLYRKCSKVSLKLYYEYVDSRFQFFPHMPHKRWLVIRGSRKKFHKEIFSSCGQAEGPLVFAVRQDMAICVDLGECDSIGGVNKDICRCRSGIFNFVIYKINGVFFP